MEEWRMIYFARALNCSVPVLEALHRHSLGYAHYPAESFNVTAKTILIVGIPRQASSYLASLLIRNSNHLIQSWDLLKWYVHKNTFENQTILLDLTTDSLDSYPEKFWQHVIQKISKTTHGQVIVTVPYFLDTPVQLRDKFQCYITDHLLSNEHTLLNHLSFPLKGKNPKPNSWLVALDRLRYKPHWFLVQNQPEKRYVTLDLNIEFAPHSHSLSNFFVFPPPGWHPSPV